MRRANSLTWFLRILLRLPAIALRAVVRGVEVATAGVVPTAMAKASTNIRLRPLQDSTAKALALVELRVTTAPL